MAEILHKGTLKFCTLCNWLTDYTFLNGCIFPLLSNGLQMVCNIDINFGNTSTRCLPNFKGLCNFDFPILV